MIITSTNHIEGYQIVDYKGIVFGEVFSGVNFLKDMGASIRNVFGGRSKGYETELLEARSSALAELEENARQLGANAIVGLHFNYAAFGEGGTMLMVTCSGTAVIIK